MDKNNRDYQILKKTVRFCQELGQTHEEYARDHQIFLTNATYRNAAALCLLQISELTGKFSPEFKEESQQIPWAAFKDLKKAILPECGELDEEQLWKLSLDGDITTLGAFCQKELEGGFAYDVQL